MTIHEIDIYWLPTMCWVPSEVFSHIITRVNFRIISPQRRKLSLREANWFVQSPRLRNITGPWTQAFSESSFSVISSNHAKGYKNWTLNQIKWSQLTSLLCKRHDAFSSHEDCSKYNSINQWQILLNDIFISPCNIPQKWHFLHSTTIYWVNTMHQAFS